MVCFAKQCCEMIPLQCLWNSCVHGKSGGMYRAHASLCLSKWQSCNKELKTQAERFDTCSVFDVFVIIPQISKQCDVSWGPLSVFPLPHICDRLRSGLNPDEIFASVHHSMLDVYCELLEAHALVHTPGIDFGRCIVGAEGLLFQPQRSGVIVVW